MKMYDSEEEKKPLTDSLSHQVGKNCEKATTNAEYFKTLEKWLRDCQSCDFFHKFPYALLGQQINPAHFAQECNFYVPPVPSINQGFGIFPYPTEQQQLQIQEGVEYRVSPLWKRFLAETIDFIILFFFKLAGTLIIIDYLNVIDKEKLEAFHQAEKFDIELAVIMSTEFLAIEVGHRIFVCVYEAYHLLRFANHQVGGATPGKLFLGIRVIFCNNIESVENQPDIVKVIPSTNATLGWALGRSVLKNFFVGLIFPICFPFFLNKHNRTIYDILCHSVVVERKPIRDI